MIIKEPKTQKDFAKYYALRWKILRQPWNQSRGSEKDGLEDSSFHIMACENNGRVIGVGRLHFNDNHQWQIRYMAVEQHCRSKGVGRAILNKLEQRAIKAGCKQIVLDARRTAIKFYEKAGYRITAAGYMLFGSVKHVKMIKYFDKDKSGRCLTSA